MTNSMNSARQATFAFSRRHHRSVRVLVALSLGVFAFGPLMAGCGSDSGITPLTSGAAGGGGAIPDGESPFTGRSYQSVVELADGQQGTLDVTVDANGQATGTLKIEDPDRSVSRLVIATPVISGTVDENTGAVNLSGSYTLNGQTIPISITGNLPNGSGGSVTGGSLSLRIGDHTFTSNWTVRVSNGGIGGGSGTTGNLPTGYVVAASAGALGQKILTITALPQQGASAPSLIMSVNYGSGQPAAGTFTVGGPQTTVAYYDGAKNYIGQSGRIVIEEVSSTIRFRVENMVLKSIGDSSTITLNGSGHTTLPYVDVDLGGFDIPGL